MLDLLTIIIRCSDYTARCYLGYETEEDVVVALQNWFYIIANRPNWTEKLREKPAMRAGKIDKCGRHCMAVDANLRIFRTFRSLITWCYQQRHGGLVIV